VGEKDVLLAATFLEKSLLAPDCGQIDSKELFDVLGVGASG
jgi:hypothetical protein